MTTMTTMTTAMMASLGRLELGAMLALQNESFVLVCTLFFGWIGFLSQTALSQPSQHKQEGLEEGVCTNSDVTPSNRVHVGWVGVEMTSPWEGERATGNFGLATNLSLLFLGRLCILCCVPQKSGFFWQEMSI